MATSKNNGTRKPGRTSPDALLTIDSFREKYSGKGMSKSISKKKSIVINLNLKTQSLTKHDLAHWRSAWQMAINVDNPRRGPLYDIYSDELVDMHLTGCISQRIRKTLLKSFVVKNAEGEEDVQAQKIFESQWFYDFLLYALDSCYWGNSVIQLGDTFVDAAGVRKYANVSLVPRKHVIPEYGVIIRDQSDSWDQGVSYREGPLADWCIEVGGSHDLGLLLKCAQQVIPKKNMLAYWDVFGEIFGMPLRIGTTTSQNPADHRRIEEMLEGMGAASWGLFPEGTSIDIKESSRGDAYNVYDKRIDRANSEISKGILNQTMTIDSGSSLSQSETHLEVFENVCAADARLIKYIVNDKLLPLMVKHGFPVAGLEFDWDDAATYTPAEQRELERMLLGFYEIDPQYFVDKYKIPIIGVKQQGDASFFE